MEHAPHPIDLQAFNSKEFRSALGSFATGVTVVTTRGASHPYGMTANAFSSVSLDPPLVLVCVRSESQGSECISQNGSFAVNILGADQEAISRYFSSRERPQGPDALGEIPHRSVVTGCPVLAGTAAYLDCKLHHSVPAGDHIIFIGEVMGIGIDPEARPLLFHAGSYCCLGDRS